MRVGSRSGRLGSVLAVLVGAGCSATVADPGPPATAVAPETAPATVSSEAPEAAPAGSGVDLILTGGLIVTMTEPAEAQAIAIDGERIVAVGDEATVAAMASEDTSVVDLEGRVVFPGFTDAHAHWYQPDRIGNYGPEQINQVLLSRGWTGTDDANVEPHFAELLFGWHRDGRIDLRMNAYLSINTPGTDLDRYGDWFTAYGIEPGSTVGDRPRIPGVKIFIGSDWDRVAKWTEEELVAAVAGYHEAGWQIAASRSATSRSIWRWRRSSRSTARATTAATGWSTRSSCVPTRSRGSPPPGWCPSSSSAASRRTWPPTRRSRS